MRTRDVASTLLVAFTLGFCLSRIGFSSWDEVHRMFVFADLRMTLAFAVGVAVLVPAWPLLARAQRVRWPRREVHRGTLAGGLLFGAGWALCGACPSIALVQLGEGQLAALVTLAGVLLGNALYGEAHARWFRWDTGSCLDQ